MNDQNNDIPEGFKQTELGLLPEGWKTITLESVASFTSKPRELDISNCEAIPFIPMEAISSDGSGHFRYNVRPGKEISSGVYCERGDLLLAKITPCLENGKQCLLGQDELPSPFAYTTTEVYPLKIDENIAHIRFLFYYLLYPPLRRELASKMEGTTGRQRLPKHVVRNTIIPLPPLPEQKAIARVLSTIQKAVETQDKIITAARELKKSLMRHLFTYGPVPVPEAENVPLKETEIGPMPEHWETIKVGDVVITTQYGLSLRGEQSGKYPILRMNNLGDGRVHDSDLQYVNLEVKDFEKFRVKKKDILFNRTNSYELVGKTALFDLEGDFVFASYLVKVVPNLTRLIPEYLNYYLNYKQVQNRLRMLATRGVSQSNINATKLRGFIICP